MAEKAGEGRERFGPTGGPAWLIGGTGQIGGALSSLLGERAIAPSRQDLEMAAPDSIRPALDRLLQDAGTPVALINAAAYTRVDQAEREETTAFTVNAESPRVLAQWCRRHSIPFVHYSTDYVYPGSGMRPWTEKDQTDPLNAYGRTKLAGDRYVQASGARHLIFRTSWVYDARGRNFFTTILRLAQERDSLQVVVDQVGAPSYAPHLARATLDALEAALAAREFPSGVYHLANTGSVSWHGFAAAICAGARSRGVAIRSTDIRPVLTTEYPVPAVRPLNSRLDLTRVRAVFGCDLPSWETGLEESLDAWVAERRAHSASLDTPG